MTTYMIIGIFLVFCVVLMAWKQLRNSPKPQDSALKQRAIFNPNEQLDVYTPEKKIFARLYCIGTCFYDA